MPSHTSYSEYIVARGPGPAEYDGRGMAFGPWDGVWALGMVSYGDGDGDGVDGVG